MSINSKGRATVRRFIPWSQTGKQLAVVMAACLLLSFSPADAADVAEVNGVRAYIGMVPAALLDPAPLRHGPDFFAWGRGGPLPDAHHLMVALFDATTGERITDASVEVVALAPGGGAPSKATPMNIQGAVVYGRLVRLGTRRINQFEIRVQRPKSDTPLVFHYSYDTRH